jgi:hypothetical protein
MTHITTKQGDQWYLREKCPYKQEVGFPNLEKSKYWQWMNQHCEDEPLLILNPHANLVEGQEMGAGVDFEVVWQYSDPINDVWRNAESEYKDYDTRQVARLKAPQGETKEHTKQTMYEVSFINFTVNGGDYMLCRNMAEVAQLLERECDHILDDDPVDIDYPYSVVIKPKVMTLSEYEKLKQEYYEQ